MKVYEVQLENNGVLRYESLHRTPKAAEHALHLVWLRTGQEPVTDAGGSWRPGTVAGWTSPRSAVNYFVGTIREREVF